MLNSPPSRRFALTIVLAFSAFACLVVQAAEEPTLPAPLKEDDKQEEPDLPAGLGANEGANEEPQLPPGLGRKSDGTDEEPGLPAGLGGDGSEGPDLPSGLGEDDEVVEETERKPSLRERLPFDLSGFIEARYGVRTQEDDHQDENAIMEEARLQLGIEKYWGSTRGELTVDFIADEAGHNTFDADLEEGSGWIDLREANVTFSPTEFMDVRAGRQILTWGTGDFVFLNDLFPKDYESFFIGRDEEYLKAPSDAVKASFYSAPANLDLVYTPRFDSDRFVTGERLSFWNPALGRRSGDDAVIEADRPDSWFQDEEWAGRLYRNVSGYELAAYAYRGFWKSPAGTDAGSGLATFPELNVYGASVRGTVGGGVGNVEFAYYDSRDDSGGDDPLVRNSELRFLVGYEREAAKNLTVGVQYYLVHMLQYGEYSRTLPPGMRRRDEDRQVLTLRLTQLLMNQNLELSLFTFYSPTAQEAYFRPSAHYDVTDRWSVEVGGNVFTGEEAFTRFNQFEDNSNVYAGVRYSF